MRLLIVEDDRELAEAMGVAFARRQVSSDHAVTLGDAELMLQATGYAAVILDLGLSDGDGGALLRRLRGRGEPIPVLVLTARGDVADRIRGLNAGADDYLVKPFEFEELLARLTAVLRRQGGGFQGNMIELGNVCFDTVSRE
ncbi:MAG: response regulator, partial [Janthinobacterium lividum]